MSENSYMALWLEAPLQAWGADSKFYRRETIDFPTKSGILGLICCALGASGNQREFLATFAPLSQLVFAFKDKTLKDGVFASIMYDFQTVGNGYNKEDKWENLHIPKKLKGKPATGSSGAKLTTRAYLQDMAFGVMLEVPCSLQDIIEQALQNPIWDLYFGRKNCAPTDFIYRGTFNQQEKAEQALLDIASKKELKVIFKVVDGECHDTGEMFVLRDVPLQFGEHKRYADRKVTKIRMV